MRRVLICVAVLAFGAAPAMAGDVSGFYAGVYGGGAKRTPTPFELGLAGAVLDGPGSFATPISFVNNGFNIDQSIIDILQAGLAHFPYADAALGFGVTLGGDVDFAPTMALGGVVGYGFGNGLRIEADLSTAAFEANNLTISRLSADVVGGSIDGSGVWTWDGGGGSIPVSDSDDLSAVFGAKLSTSTQFLLANGWYDVGTGTALTPYFGGGLGLARVTSVFSGLFDADVFNSTASEIVPAAQLGAGLRYAVNDKVSFDLGYRYKLAFNSTLKNLAIVDLGEPGFVGVEGIQTGAIGVHVVQAGVTFALN